MFSQVLMLVLGTVGSVCINIFANIALQICHARGCLSYFVSLASC